MNSRALLLALRLLSTACAGVALVSMAGCPFFFGCGDSTGWQTPVALDLGGVGADLLAIAPLFEDDGDRYWHYIAVGTGGTIVVWGQDWAASQPFSEVFGYGDATLRGAVSEGGSWWVVGDGGTMAVSQDRGQSWTAVESGTSASLHAIARHDNGLVAVGDDVVVMQGADGTWAEVPAPGGGWGQLRSLFSDGTTIWAVGLGGAAWSSIVPGSAWTAEDTGLGADLLGICRVGYGEELIAVGAAGSVAIRSSSGGWSSVDTGIAADLISCSESGVLASDGEVYDFESDGSFSSVGNFAGGRAVDYSDFSRLVVVGQDGSGQQMDYYECIGGRPFIVDQRLRTAMACPSRDWLDGERGPSEVLELDGELAAEAAAAWVRDGLYEHASIASFARFGLELLALGAPARLLVDVSGAIADEIEHARLCFGVAERLGGVGFGPGPMAIEQRAFTRVGDVVATALALFEEGCVNESVAACEAADAAELAEDPQLRRVLEIIANDERRHATMAWAALRWMVETYPQVLAPLRSRVATLAASPAHGDHDFDSRLGALGRLAPSRRARIRAEVIGAVVRPLAQAMIAELEASSDMVI